jgi:hypothetical protein
MGTLDNLPRVSAADELSRTVTLVDMTLAIDKPET